MKIYIYKGGLPIVKNSGVGSAILQQKRMLKNAGVPLTDDWEEATVVHINTVFPDSFWMAKKSKKAGKKVVYYGHSTMEDFRDSFIGSNLAAPIFKHWISLCYRQGDIIVTPTSYSKGILESYGISKRIYVLSNGVDTEFFHQDEKLWLRFREEYQISQPKKVVISAGHWIERKGILDFLELAKRMPDVLFFWFGGGNENWIPAKIKKAIQEKPENVIMAGFVEKEKLREAYCGADAFVFFSKEETEGMVVLEALASGCPVVLRDIPVYRGWLQKDKQVKKAADLKEYQSALESIFTAGIERQIKEGRRLAEEHSLGEISEKLNRIYQIERFASRTEKGRTIWQD